MERRTSGNRGEDATSTAGRHSLPEAKFRELLPCARRTPEAVHCVTTLCGRFLPAGMAPFLGATVIYPEATSSLTVRLCAPARVRFAVGLRASLATPADPKSQPLVPDAPEHPLSCFHSESMRLPSGLLFQPGRWLTHR